MKRIVAVGASAAGLAAAETLRRKGYDGTPTLVGDEPHQSYDRPPLPKQFLTGRWVPPASVAGTKLGLGLSQAHLQRGARPCTGAVLSEVTEAEAVPGDGQVVEGGEVLVALGSHPDTEWLAVHDRVAYDVHARSRPAYTRPGTWPAGRTRRSRCPRGSSTAPAPPIGA